MKPRWRVAICPYCGNREYYRPVSSTILNRMSEWLKVDMTWDRKIHCTNCARDFKIPLLDDFF